VLQRNLCKVDLFGEPFQIIDLVALENGGTCIGYSNVHFGHARNLIQPGKADTMADGWETARKVSLLECY
jgi:allantoicase